MVQCNFPKFSKQIDTKDPGVRTDNTDKVVSIGVTGLSTKVGMKMVKKLGMGNFIGEMVQNTKGLL